MADLSESDFLKRIGMADTNAISLLPATEQEVQRASANYAQTRAASPVVQDQQPGGDEALVKLGARPGVPMDMESGIPFMTRLRSEFQPTPEEEEKALTNVYGQGNVRRNGFGWLIVTKPGKDGKPTDTLVDPVGVDTGDLATVLKAMPSIIGGGLAMKGASFAPGIVNAGMNLLRMTAGSRVAQGLTDAAVRESEGNPVNPGEIAQTQAGGAALDLALGAGIGLGAKAVGTAISPFAKPSGLQFDARSAQRYFFDKYGVWLDMTPAEMTGSGLLQRLEALEAQKPGASIPFEKLMKARQESIEELRRMALNGNVPSEEEVARKALSAIGSKLAPLDRAVESAAFETRVAAENEIASTIGTKVDDAALGKSMRERAEALRAEFQAKSKAEYDKVYSNPLTQEKNISGGPLADDAVELEKKLPSINERVNRIDYDQYGNPIEVQATKVGSGQVLKEFVPDSVLPKLQALKRGASDNFRLDELIAMRGEISNDIAQGEAVPGVQTRYLGKLRDALTTRIKEGLQKLDPQLLSDWETANKNYAEGIAKFQKHGISNFFKHPEQPGFLGDTKIVNRVMGEEGRDLYAAYKDFFGANSPEMAGVAQAARDDVLGLSNLSTTIDARGLASRLEALDRSNPELLKDAFGANAKKLRESAKALSAARGENLPQNELLEAINSGNLSGKKLLEMQAAQAKRDDVYRNTLLKKISAGNIEAERIKPSEFVNSFVFKSEPAELKEAMGQLVGHPEIQEDIRRLTFQRVLDDATVVNKSTGMQTLSANDLEKVLGNEVDSKRLRTVLGPSTFEDLVQLKNFLKPGTVQQQAMRSAGGLSAGMQIAGLAEGGLGTYVPRAVKNFVLAQIYTNPATRAWIGNTAMDAGKTALVVNSLIASTPFLEALTKTTTQAGARKAVLSLKEGADAIARQNPGSSAVPQDLSEDEFKRRIGL